VREKEAVLPYITTPALATIVMATTPLNVSARSDSIQVASRQTEAQGANIEMQARLPVDSDDAPIGSSDTAAWLADAQVLPSVFVAPPDAAEAEKRMLDAICGALEQGPRAVVDAMWIALRKPESHDMIYESKSDFEEMPISAACALDQSFAVISKLMQAFPDHCKKNFKKGKNGRTAVYWAARRNSNAAVISELLKVYPEAAGEKDEYGRLPLHDAAWNNSNVAVIIELLKVYPEAAREKDELGLLPLQIAEEYNSNAAVILELLKAYPDAVAGDEVKQKCLSALSQAVDLPYSMMKSSPHPLQACIRLSAELMAFSRRQRSKDIRLANDADERGSELEQLACAIARSCKCPSHWAMDECLQLAADLKLKFFISEPACSRRVEELWWTGMTFNLGKPYDGTSILYIFYTYLVSLMYNFISPLVRFLMNRASYLAFLVCLLQLPVQVAPGDPVSNIGFEIFLAYWLFDICFSEAVEFLDIMQMHSLTVSGAVAKYAEDPWNVYDVLTLSAAVAAAVVRGLVHAGVGVATAAASNQLQAWALALLWGKLVNVLYVVSFIGPLLIMVLVMVFRDLSKFAVLVMLMELPFVVALYFLESGDGGNEAFATFPQSALSFSKIVLGQGPDISSVTAPSSVLLLSIGSVLLSVLLLNLLIAMFSKTFDTIVENSAQEYLLQKAQLTFAWARAPPMPPPLAFLQALRDFCIRIYWCCMRCARDPERVENRLPIFDKKHFFEIVFPQKVDVITEQEHVKNPAKREEWTAQWMNECEAKHDAWCERVLADLEENAEFNSEAQMDKFKSRMLRGMDTTVESSGKIDRIAENAKATQEQVKALSEAVQQMHASMQLILQKLDP
jgi:hypothetical protein